MMLRIIAVIFGVAFIFAGISGFISVLTVNGFLFNLFEVDTVHNLIHIVSGVIAIMAATSLYYTRLYFKIFGTVYLIVAILGFLLQGDLLIMHVNTADNFLHLGIAVVALYLGFAVRTETV